jgi:hypothetical protein
MKLASVLGRGAVALFMAGAALAFVALEPSRTITGEAGLRAFRALVAVPWFLACVGAGGALLGRFLPRALDDELGWVRALATGLVAWGLVSLPVALLGGLGTTGAWILLCVLALGWLARPRMRLPTGHAVSLLVVLLPFVLVLFDVVAPAIDTDELYYHLALPRQMLEAGALVGGTWAPNGSRPLALHLPWAFLLATGGETAPRFFHLLLGATLLWSVQTRLKTALGVGPAVFGTLLLAGSTTFLDGAGLARSDIPTAFLVFMAFDAGIAGGLLPLVALAAGGALAIKYTAGLALAPIFLVLPFFESGSVRRRVLATAGTGLLALVLLLPWWLRNVADGLHPLFPFAGWPPVADPGMVFQYAEKYGPGRGLADLLLLPVNLVTKGDPESFAGFLGRVSPAFLALLPAAFWAAFRSSRTRAALFVAAGAVLLWALQIQWLRYLLPALPIAAVAMAGGYARLSRPLRALAWLVLLAGLPANLAPVLEDAAKKAVVATGHETRDAFYMREMPAWPAVRWINERTPSDAVVALLFAWEIDPLQRRAVLGSVEDHVPTRHFLAMHGQESLRVLQAAGVTHVLVGRAHFIKKVYPFLSKEDFEASFAGPERRLEDLLEQQARLVFEEGRFAVWELGEPSPGGAAPDSG